MDSEKRLAWLAVAIVIGVAGYLAYALYLIFG
jgi:hypothetical protein